MQRRFSKTRGVVFFNFSADDEGCVAIFEAILIGSSSLTGTGDWSLSY